MANKSFTSKAGYQDLLDYDPKNGIVKYGAYEAFIDQLDLKPTKTTVTYSDFKLSGRPSGMASAIMFPASVPTMDQFHAAVADGSYTGAPKAQTSGVPSMADMNGLKDPKPSIYRKINKLGPDSYEIETYDIPTSVDFVNKLSTAASGIMQQNDTGALNQNKQDASSRRQGRASTILSSAAGTAAVNS